MAKRPGKALPTMNPTTSAGQVTSGMCPPDYGAAVDLQVAIRDTIKRPVSLREALRFATLHFRNVVTPEVAAQWAEMYDAERIESERARLAEQQRISAEAGSKRRQGHAEGSHS